MQKGENFVSEEDAEEYFNDTLLSIRNSIPPNKPKVTGYGESKIKSKLFRMRNRLRKYLEGRYRI